MQSSTEALSRAGENYSTLLFALARAANARRILEIGAGPGVSGRAFAAALLGQRDAELWSVEPDPGCPPADAARYAAGIGIQWRILRGDSLRVELPEAAWSGFDLLYIDGDHGGDHALGDFHRFAPFVRPGGLIVYDDFPIADGVKYAVDELVKGGWSGLRLPYNHLDGNSFYVVRKLSES